MKQKAFDHFHKTLRKYWNLQQRLVSASDESQLGPLLRKLDILKRRLLRLNRQWKLGIATATLIAWMLSPLQAQMYPSIINLDTLNGNNGFAFNGLDVFDNSGLSVSGVGDINGDGLDDIIIGTPGGDSNGNFDSGVSYVVFGANTFADSINPNDLNGSNGFVINGIDKDDRSGYSVSGAGDINGDGLDDIIIGGKSSVVFGAKTFASSLNLANLNGTNGFVINGMNSTDGFFPSVSGAGDINGDGLDDIILGAWRANNDIGESYVIFGANTFSDSLNLADLNGTNGFVVKGVDEDDSSGNSVSGTGDINGDGLDDIIIGAFRADANGNYEAGESYVVFGSNTFTDSLTLANLNGTNGFVINGIDKDDRSGRSVSGVGDVNGDGIDDMIIGAADADPKGISRAGEVYVVFGTNSFAASFNLSALNGTNGFVINGIDVDDFSGASVSGVGDVNGDGIDDIIIGAPWADPNGNSYGGKSYVIFGANTFNNNLNLADLNGTNGFIINGVATRGLSGASVSGAGDINGDNLNDIIIGTPDATSNGNPLAGKSYVVFGWKVSTSIGELENTFLLKTFPNPTSSKVILQATTFNQGSKVEITLFDLMGRIVEAPSHRISSDRFELDMADLPKGTYLLRAVIDGEMGTTKVVRE